MVIPETMQKIVLQGRDIQVLPVEEERLVSQVDPQKSRQDARKEECYQYEDDVFPVRLPVIGMGNFH